MLIISNNSYKSWLSTNYREEWLTFFTPSYNRAKFLPRIYKCLSNQTNRCFVWVLVCDGSEDNSIEIAKNLLSREEFPMLFIYKENGGKHSAFKVALDHTITEFFICMDDDDLYHPETVDTFLNHIGKIRITGSRIPIINSHMVVL